MKKVIFRVDVCLPTASMFSNRLKLRFGYLKYLNTLFSLMREHGITATLMFVPNRTEPTEQLVGELVDLRCEIAMHADEVVPDRLSCQARKMEKIVGRRIRGISYHGRDLSDFLIHKFTRKTRYIAYHNPFASLQAGFEYDATGFVSNRPQSLEFGTKRILLFQGFTDVTARPMPVRYDTYDRPRKLHTDEWIEESMFDDPFAIFLVHPFYLNRYGYKKKRIRLVSALFDYVRRKEFTVRTYEQALQEIGLASGHALGVKTTRVQGPSQSSDHRRCGV